MRTIEITEGQVLVDGQARVLLMSSLFPFRIPRQQWPARIDAVKALGYDMLDVYIPWNYHETEPGMWDFEGQKDVSAFLALAHNAGLLVLARPGPYICSEWDGGGLPAWLATIPGLQIRQNEPTYLAQVARWYDQVLPILARHQYPDGGAVAMVQLDNELDFYDCADPAGYIGALAGLAHDHGIRVPLVACAGQGDIARATGNTPGVFPGVNLYPSDDSDHVEDTARYYDAALAARGLPLLVTETNRAHRTLKRLLASGAKLLGPYLQLSGWNNDYGTAINNWGDPLGFLTHDYDFGGAISPDGHERPDAAQARALTQMIRRLGQRLAKAVPGTPEGIDDADGLIVAALDLHGGGQLLSLTNLSDDTRNPRVRPRPEPIPVPPGATVLVTRETVADTGIVTPETPQPPVTPYAGTPARAALITRGQGPAGWETHRTQVRPAALEYHGIYRGAGRYTATIPPDAIGIVVRSAADIIDVRCGQWRSGWFANGGTDRWIPCPPGLTSQDLAVTVRIWGHSNFDDARLPSLRLGSLKGVTGILAVTRQCDLSTGWTPTAITVTRQDDLSTGWTPTAITGPRVGADPPPVSGVGWMSGVYPQVMRYSRRVGPAHHGYAALHVPGLRTRIDVAVNTRAVATLTPLVTTCWLGELHPDDDITLTVTRTWGEDVGAVTLLLGLPLETCDLEKQDTATLINARNLVTFTPDRLPIEVPPGDHRWIRVPAAALADGTSANVVLRATGEHLLITALAGDTNLGRLWAGDVVPGAQLKGGRGDVLLVPTDSAADLDLLLEATTDRPGTLTTLTIDGAIG